MCYFFREMLSTDKNGIYYGQIFEITLCYRINPFCPFAYPKKILLFIFTNLCTFLKKFNVDFIMKRQVSISKLLQSFLFLTHFTVVNFWLWLLGNANIQCLVVLTSLMKYRFLKMENPKKYFSIALIYVTRLQS